MSFILTDILTFFYNFFKVYIYLFEIFPLIFWQYYTFPSFCILFIFFRCVSCYYLLGICPLYVSSKNFFINKKQTDDINPSICNWLTFITGSPYSFVSPLFSGFTLSSFVLITFLIFII